MRPASPILPKLRKTINQFNLALWRIFEVSGSFNNTAQNGYFCWFEAKYLRNGSKYCSDFWYQVKTWCDEDNYQAILSEKVWIIQKWSWIIQKFEFFQKKKFFSKFLFFDFSDSKLKKRQKNDDKFFSLLMWSDT